MTTTRACACLSDDALECAELRWYGYYPALDWREQYGMTEHCSCICHTQQEDVEIAEGEVQ